MWSIVYHDLYNSSTYVTKKVAYLDYLSTFDKWSDITHLLNPLTTDCKDSLLDTGRSTMTQTKP